MQPLDRYSIFIRMMASTCALGVVASLSAQAAGNLNNKVSVGKGGPVGTLTITNIATTSLLAPMVLTIKDLTGQGVAVLNNTTSAPGGNAVPRESAKNGMLATGEQVLAPLKFINPQRIAFTYQVGASGTGLDTSNSATLRVSVYAFSGDSEHPRGAPVGAGYAILVDGVPRAITDATGVATLPVPLSSTSVSALHRPSEAGTAPIAPVAGQTQAVDIIVSDDAELYGDANLRIDQVRQALLPGDFTALRLRFIDRDGNTIKLIDLIGVELYDGDDRSLGLQTKHFQLEKEGTVVLIDLASIRNLLDRPGRLQLELMGTDAQGVEYSGRVAFYVSHKRISGTPRDSLPSSGRPWP